MVTALQTAAALPRRGWRRPRSTVEAHWVAIGNTRYRQLTARPDRKGRFDWAWIRQEAEEEAERLLVAQGICLPADSGLGRFTDSGRLQRELMAVTAAYLLRRAGSARRMQAAIYDPAGDMPCLAEALLPYAAEVRIVTDRPQQYAQTEAEGMRRYGATFLITRERSALLGVPLVLGPSGFSTLAGARPGRGVWLSGRTDGGRLVVDGYVPRTPPAWLAALPRGCDPWLCLAALHECAGLRGLLDYPPVALRRGGVLIRPEDLVWKLAGLDIGISV